MLRVRRFVRVLRPLEFGDFVLAEPEALELGEGFDALDFADAVWRRVRGR